jgi:hypothetical protein
LRQIQGAKNQRANIGFPPTFAFKYFNMQQELIIKMALDAWNQYVKRTGDLLAELSDEELWQPLAPGRNRGVYIVGHLITIHGRMIPLLGFGEHLFSELYDPFVTKPDGDHIQDYKVSDLREYWNEVHAKLSTYFSQMSTDQWFERHNSVSEEDFKKEPHRNKLNIVINRTNHLASHFGQLIFLKPRKD